MQNNPETPANVEDVGQPKREASLAAPNGYAAEWCDYVPHSRGLVPTVSLRWKDGTLYQWWESTYARVPGCWVKVGSEPHTDRTERPGPQ